MKHDSDFYATLDAYAKHLQRFCYDGSLNSAYSRIFTFKSGSDAVFSKAAAMVEKLNLGKIEGNETHVSITFKEPHVARTFDRYFNTRSRP